MIKEVVLSYLYFQGGHCYCVKNKQEGTSVNTGKLFVANGSSPGQRLIGLGVKEFGWK